MSDKHYGGFWRRGFAFAVDQAILYLLSLILLVVGLLAHGTNGPPGRAVSVETLLTGMGSLALLHMLATFLITIAYFTWFHGLTGQTPGKMLLGLRVVQASGEPMTPGVAFLRTAGYLISALFLWLGFLWIVFDRRKQGWHDKIAATAVLRVKREPVGSVALLSAERSTSDCPPIQPEMRTSEASAAFANATGEEKSPEDPENTKGDEPEWRTG